ncbi:MAG: nucleotidyltransferase [Lachnospiraceae bacterium]|nr:nucleotidyltransferase [Lachnospiraceae bacterium]
MKILIPMAGEGKRFADVGYTVSKPAIPTYDKRTGKQVPMVVCATLDLPGVMPGGGNVIYVDRDFHRANGTEEAIRRHLPEVTFITVDHLTEGQACTCLLAEQLINNEEELLIAGCDNGMEIDRDLFDSERTRADMLVFTYRHNASVLRNPDAYGWVKADKEGNVTGISIKKALSETPMEDHAIVATFWFKQGNLFVKAAQKMIDENDRVNNEFYVDQVIKHVMELGYRVKVFEIDRYIGWGTPGDYELYQKTFAYWKGFYEREETRMFS